MNKIVSFVLIIVVLGGAYTGASWFYGKQTELALSEQYDKALEKLPFIKIIERDYQRGIFASTEILNIEIKAPGRANAGRKAQSVDSKSLKLAIHSNIQHGPLPGFSTLAAVWVHSEIRIPDDVELSELKQLKGKSIFSQNMSVGFDGNGKVTFKSPKFDYSNQNPGKKLELSWQGFTGDLVFADDMKQFKLTAQAPSMKITTNESDKINISDISYSGDRQQIFEDISSVYSGPQRFSIADITVFNQKLENGPVVMKQFSYDVDVVKEGDFLNLIGRLGMEKIQVGNDAAIGPVHYDISLKHLLARTFATLNEEMMTFNKKILNPDAHESVSEEALLPVFKKYAQTLLDNEPELHFDRISLATANGEASLKGKMTLGELKFDEAINNPQVLLAHLKADIDFSLEENMIIELLRNPPKSYLMNLKGLSAEEQKAALERQIEQFQQQVAMFSKMGYITREGAVLKSNAEFKAGQLLVNGKPMPVARSSAPVQNEQAPLQSGAVQSGTVQSGTAPIEEESVSKEMVN